MNRITLGLILAMIFNTALCAPRTLRVDFYHSGNSDTEMFSLDQVVLEPLAFPGNLARPLDTTLRGKYLFEIIASGSQELVWSRSFSSIYGEWETTGEARKINRTFHESVRFPAQRETFELVLKKRDPHLAFKEVWRIEIDPNDYLVHQESATWADRVIAIEDNGEPGQKVDILILGDGYTAAEQGVFVETAKAMAEKLFATEPFKKRRDDFNIWAIAPPTREAGVSRPSTHTYRDTPLGVSYDAFRSERYILTYENKAMRRIASSAPYDFIEIISNTDTYGGGGIYGLYATVAANSVWANYLFIHEFGHHFAGLADEYYTSSVAYETPETRIEPYEPNVTALLDPNALKWRHLVDSGTPLPTPWPKDAYDEHSIATQKVRAQMRKDNVPESEMDDLFRWNQQVVEELFSSAPHRNAIGAFEGANYRMTGQYRSEQNCIMFTRTTYFCQVCSDAIEQVIDEYTSK